MKKQYCQHIDISNKRHRKASLFLCSVQEAPKSIYAVHLAKTVQLPGHCEKEVLAITKSFAW